MAKPRSAPTAAPFELPELPDLTPSYDPFQVAKQFDSLRSSLTGGGASPFQMPQPKPIQFGGQLPAAPAKPAAGGHFPGDGHNHGPAAPAGKPPTAAQVSDWGAKTQTFQQQFPTLRHTSGYRSPEHNARTPGAAKNSLHMQRDQAGNARANDYVGSPRDMAAAAAWAKANGAREVLIHNAGTGQHLHVAW